MKQYEENQVLGYLIMSLKQLERSEEEIEKTIKQMKQNMEVYVEQYAENIYLDF